MEYGTWGALTLWHGRASVAQVRIGFSSNMKIANNSAELPNSHPILTHGKTNPEQRRASFCLPAPISSAIYRPFRKMSDCLRLAHGDGTCHLECVPNICLLALGGGRKRQKTRLSLGSHHQLSGREVSPAWSNGAKRQSPRFPFRKTLDTGWQNPGYVLFWRFSKV